jgi:hypothetical protein
MNKRMNIALAFQTFGNPVGIIFYKIHNKHTNNVGAPSVLSKHEELALIENALIAAEWGYPLNLMDIRFYAKSYLDRVNKIVPHFKNNFP